MKTTQYTPGPWAVIRRADGMGCNQPGNYALEIVRDYDGGQDVIVGKHTGIDCLNHANARLIAAVPDLLAALEELEIVVYRLCGDDLPGFASGAVVEARAAIAKATGKGEA